MRVPPHIVITFSIVFICWCFTEAGWLISKKQKSVVQTRGKYSFELSQRDLSHSTCTECLKVKDRSKSHVLYENRNDTYTIESLHDAITAIATVVIATSWLTLFYLFLHNRFQRNIDQRFQAIVIAQWNPHETFIVGRRQG